MQYIVLSLHMWYIGISICTNSAIQAASTVGCQQQDVQVDTLPHRTYGIVSILQYIYTFPSDICLNLQSYWDRHCLIAVTKQMSAAISLNEVESEGASSSDQVLIDLLCTGITFPVFAGQIYTCHILYSVLAGNSGVEQPAMIYYGPILFVKLPSVSRYTELVQCQHQHH